MPKSTPLNQLPNQQAQDENKENELVSEILQEIENSDQTNQQTPMSMPQANQPNDQYVEQAQVVPQQQEPAEMMDFIKTNSNISNENRSFIDSITETIKQPLIVALLIMVLSVSRVDKLLTNILPNRSFVLNNPEVFINLTKGIIGAILFYLLDRTL